MYGQLERAVARHCAPVLIGSKPAAIVCLPAIDQEELLALAGKLKTYGVRLFPLRRGEERCLLMLFSPERLGHLLTDGPAAQALSSMGYTCGKGLADPLLRLRRRCCRKDFPHEIGFFLGYPYEDVMGFIRYRGRNYKWAGPWKVYGDVDKARRICSDYSCCRQALGRHLDAGGTLEDFPCNARERLAGA